MPKFVQIPIGIANSEGGEKVTTARFAPEFVEYYYPGFYEGTVVVMRCGHSFLTTLSVEEVDELLARELKSKP